MLTSLALSVFLCLVATGQQYLAFGILSTLSPPTTEQYMYRVAASSAPPGPDSTTTSQEEEATTHVHADEPPALPERQSHTYNFTVAACVVVKDAEAYFEEWIDYHVGAMKVDQVYLYDHSVGFELQRWYNNSRDDPIYSRTEVIHYEFTGSNYNEEKGGYNQEVVYQDCVERFGKDGPKHDYMAFFDIDEFLVPQVERYFSIHSILEEYLVPYGGSLVVNWMLFGTANKNVYSPVPVTKRFQYRERESHGVIKSIAKTSDYRSHRNPHSINLLGNATVRTTKYPGCIHQASITTSTGASDPERPSNVALLYHYRYTSMKEYLFKRCFRRDYLGGTNWCNKEGTGLKESVKEHILPRPGSVYDDTAWKLLTRHVPKYRLYDDFGWKDYSRR